MHNPMRRKKNPEPDYGSHIMRLKPLYQKELGIADFNLHSDENLIARGTMDKLRRQNIVKPNIAITLFSLKPSQLKAPRASSTLPVIAIKIADIKIIRNTFVLMRISPGQTIVD